MVHGFKSTDNAKRARERAGIRIKRKRMLWWVLLHSDPANVYTIEWKNDRQIAEESKVYRFMSVRV